MSESTPEKKNGSPAHRVWEAVNRLAPKLSGESLAQAWQESLSIKGNGTAFLRLISEFHRQVDAIEEALKSRGVPKALYSSCLKSVRGLANPASLGQSGKSLRDSHLKPETLLALQWIDFILPKEEAYIEQEALVALRLQLEELVVAIMGNVQLSDFLRSFIENRIAEIRTALEDYEIAGAGKIDAALREGEGALRQYRDQMIAEAGAVEGEGGAILNRLGRLYSDANAAFDNTQYAPAGISYQPRHKPALLTILMRGASVNEERKDETSAL